MLGGGGQVHVINPHASSSDDLKPSSGGLKNLTSDLGSTANNQRVAKRDLGAKLFRTQIIGAVDVGEVLQEIDSSFAELFRNQDGRFGVHSENHEPGGVAVVAAAATEGDGGEGGRKRKLVLP